jgi:hypothetical protein
MIMKGDPKAWKALGAGSCAIIAHLNKAPPAPALCRRIDLFTLILAREATQSP